jgi:epoxyqueuosine reductase
MSVTLTVRIKEKAHDLGFDLIGIAPAHRAPHAQAFYRWLKNNYHAGMQWLARNPERRVEPQQVVAGARSAVVVGLSYYVVTPPQELWNDPARGRIARYAWGLDYHDIMLPRLRSLEDFIARESRQTVNRRSYVDTGPLLERELAAQAGVGFVGKNSLLISPRHGSYLFLGEILVGEELDYDQPATENGASCTYQPDSPGQASRRGSCGQCSRCLELCPTHAFPAPYVLNSNRCISYLTIEHKESIPLALRPLFKNWIFGCDECQEVCPWVRRYSQPTHAKFLEYKTDLAIPRLIDLMSLDNKAFRHRFKGSPIIRTKRRGLLRNVAVALGNWGHPDAIPVLEQASLDPDPMIREHAVWAIQQIKKGAV